MNTLTFYGFDPGPQQTGWAKIEIDQDGAATITGGVDENHSLAVSVAIVEASSATGAAVETIVSYGRAGQSVIDTAMIAGQMMATIATLRQDKCIGRYGISRRDVKRELFGSVKGNDKTIRAYLISRWNLKPNHLKSHAWQALAVATVVYDRWKKERGL